MNPEYRNIELFECIASKAASPDQIEKFEKQLVNDPSFKEDWEAFCWMNEVVIEKELVDLKETISSDLDAILRDSKQKKSTKKKWLIGIVLLSLTAILLFLYFGNTGENDDTKKPNKNVSKTEFVEEPISKDKKDNNLSPEIPLISFSTELKPKENNKLINVNDTSYVTVDTVFQLKDELINPSSDTLRADLSKKINITYSPEGTETNEIDSCENISIKSSKLVITPSTMGYTNGHIQFNSAIVTGGEEPYLFSLEEKDYEEVNEFNDLEQGGYTLYVQDQNGCEVSTELFVKEEVCLKKYRNQVSLANMEWLLPNNTNYEGSGAFQLYDQMGKIIYTENLNSVDYYHWDGITFNGTKVLSGYYEWTIEYQNGDYCKGELTIFE